MRPSSEVHLHSAAHPPSTTFSCALFIRLKPSQWQKPGGKLTGCLWPAELGKRSFRWPSDFEGNAASCRSSTL